MEEEKNKEMAEVIGLGLDQFIQQKTLFFGFKSTNLLYYIPSHSTVMCISTVCFTKKRAKTR